VLTTALKVNIMGNDHTQSRQHVLLAIIFACATLITHAEEKHAEHAPASNTPKKTDITAAPQTTTKTKKTIEESPETVGKLKTLMEKGWTEKAPTITIHTKDHPHRPQKKHTAKKKTHEHTTSNTHAQHLAHWRYEGENGPQFWAKIAPENSLCSTGKTQSPIHIQDEHTMTLRMDPLQFDYRPSAGTMINNGHTLQFNLSTDNYFIVRNQRYRLIQFHFHHPAEERINHKGFELVAHFVHKNDQGQLAVVAVLFDPGTENPSLEKLWANMPFNEQDKVIIQEPIINLTQLLPKEQQYYQFIGSLTTPPCSENILWTVLKHPITASKKQLDIFSKIFPLNARPIQPTNNRIIKQSD
jgi:carbonic anhydrase